jgi:hypothetical protein
MKRFRKLGFALWLALAILVGQQAAALHDLGHAAAQITDEGAPPSSSPCDKHFLFAQSFGPAGAFASVPAVSAGVVATTPRVQQFAPAATRFAFRSRAPPTFL